MREEPPSTGIQAALARREKQALEKQRSIMLGLVKEYTTSCIINTDFSKLRIFNILRDYMQEKHDLSHVCDALVDECKGEFKELNDFLEKNKSFLSPEFFTLANSLKEGISEFTEEQDKIFSLVKINLTIISYFHENKAAVRSILREYAGADPKFYAKIEDKNNELAMKQDISDEIIRPEARRVQIYMHVPQRQEAGKRWNDVFVQRSLRELMPKAGADEHDYYDVTYHDNEFNQRHKERGEDFRSSYRDFLKTKVQLEKDVELSSNAEDGAKAQKALDDLMNPEKNAWAYWYQGFGIDPTGLPVLGNNEFYRADSHRFRAYRYEQTLKKIENMRRGELSRPVPAELGNFSRGVEDESKVQADKTIV